MKKNLKKISLKKTTILELSKKKKEQIAGGFSMDNSRCTTCTRPPNCWLY